MRTAFLSATIVLCTVFHSIGKTSAWFLFNTHSSCHGGKPYYFGTTDLLCMAIGRRSAPSRFDLSLSHRWILFDGEYFEWGVGSPKTHHYGTALNSSQRCSTHREGRPAGYSRLDKTCIEKCARSYRGKYGSYNLLTNNCHDFANRLSEVLCNLTTCPSWCQ